MIKKRITSSFFAASVLFLLKLAFTTGANASENAVVKVSFQPRGVSYSYTMDDLKSLGGDALSTPLPWNREILSYKGVYLSDLIGSESSISTIEHMKVIAANGYVAEMSGQAVRESDFFLAYQKEGRKLSIRDKGPLMLISDLNGLNDDQMSRLTLSYHLVWFVNEIVVYEK